MDVRNQQGQIQKEYVVNIAKLAWNHSFSLFVFTQVREKDECILANLKQYNCDKSYVDVLVSDFSNSIWHKNIQFDRIITDRKWSRQFFKNIANENHQNKKIIIFTPLYSISTVWHTRSNRKNRSKTTQEASAGTNRATLPVNVTIQPISPIWRFVEICFEPFENERSHCILATHIQVIDLYNCPRSVQLLFYNFNNFFSSLKHRFHRFHGTKIHLFRIDCKFMSAHQFGNIQIIANIRKSSRANRW